jgi:hypothetical protein
MSNSSQCTARFYSSRSSAISAILIVLALVLTNACGSNGPQPPAFSGNTSVTVVLSSTANDELTEFDLGFEELTLTSQSGKTVSLFAGGSPEWGEFIHLNAGIEPWFTATVPQDIYTSATLTPAGAEFTCLTLLPAADGGDVSSDTYAYGQTPDANVTVTLPAPITITGDSMGLVLNMQVSQSATFPSSCYEAGGGQYSITPTFNLTPMTFAAQPTNSTNGQVLQLDGQITAIGSNGASFTLALPESPRTVSISSGSSTIYQGINNFSALAIGTFVDLDGAIQGDGSILASRIAVENQSAVDMESGPLLFVDTIEPALSVWGREQQGIDFMDTRILGGQFFSFDNAVFQISGQMTNLQGLPFVASFNGSNMVAGQNIYLSSPKLTDTANPYTEVYAITLMPQTINGTVLASAPSGSFTDYTVQLAAYDLFPTLAIQQGQTTLLTNPSVVEVYVDNNTQLLNTQTLGGGSTLRFYGLVFNDSGTLRMDCAQVNDGVSFLTQSNSRSRMETSRSQVIRQEGIGRHEIMVVKHSAYTEP